MIEQPGKKKMLLFSGSSNVELAQKVASNLGTELSEVERKEFASDEILKKYIKTFFQLFARNQWKRERTAPSFHFDDYSLDASSWLRFPILSNNFEEEIDNL